jgi:ATP-dependent Clp protease protease subunit
MINVYDVDDRLSKVLYKDDPDKILLTLQQPKVIKVNTFNEASVKVFESDMSAAHATGQEIIPIICDSFGGQVYSLMAMIDMINQSHKPVATIVIGKAMSCGSVLASCGTPGFRFMGENATMMIHDVSSGSIGKVTEIKASAEETERLNRLFFSILDKNAGKEKNYFWNILQSKGRADWHLTAKEAKSKKIIDRIGIPSFKTEIIVEQELVY